MNCEICKREFSSNIGLSLHLKIHDLTWFEYLRKFNKFPKCKYCSDFVKIIANGAKLSTLCEKDECLAKSFKERMADPSVRKKIREGRLKYMKDNPQKTAWRNSTLSYPEKLFLNYLKKNNWNEKYNIVREFPVHPYFIDFAFIDIKVAVEIDGSQHLLEDRKMWDNKKDILLRNNNWRIFRVEATNLYHDIEKVFIELDKFINEGSLKIQKVKIFSKILKGKEHKELMYQNKKKKIKKKEKETKEFYWKKD